MDLKQKLWRLSGSQYDVYIVCPKFFAAILNQTLTGWSICEIAECNDPDVTINFNGTDYLIDAKVLTKPQNHVDLIDALNRFYLCLAYYICGQNDEISLLHCAAFFEGNRTTIVVGKKNIGKSSIVYKKALQRVKIIADDILFWHQKLGKFSSIGLPLRLRRPVITWDGYNANPDHFFAGSTVVYSKNTAFDIAPIGETFLIDELLEVKENFICKPVSLWKTPGKLAEFLIDEKYTDLKKTRI